MGPVAIVFLLRSAGKSHSLQDLMKCGYVLFCLEIVALHMSAACLKYTIRKKLSCKNCV